MKPSLDNAYARLDRAKQHLTRIKGETTIFWRSLPSLGGYIDPETGGTITVDHARMLIPSILNILVRETIYNLRAALDYLVYELALLDSGQPQEGTQFPIEDTLEGWQVCIRGGKRGKGCYLRGLSGKHKERIQTLQPCFGCEWTRLLRDVSNPDKHRTLTIVKARQTFRREPKGNGLVIINPSRKGRTTLFSLRIGKHGNPLDVNTNVSSEISFSDGFPVIKTLQVIQSQVARVLNEFKPEFE
jgi:hypothetical protein